MFGVKGKVALVTGGASGIGFACAKEVLKNGAKGVTLADINPETGAKALKEIELEFGKDRAIFSLTDVTKTDQFERAFQQTIDKFNNIDILFNNAGIVQDCNWRREIDINLTATVQGCLLALDKYFPKYKQGEEAVIVNTSSVAATEAVPFLRRSWGSPPIYNKTKVRFVAFCPGSTMTPVMADLSSYTLGEMYAEIMNADVPYRPTQEADQLAREVMKIVKNAASGTVWVIEGGEPAYQFTTADRSTMTKNVIQE